MLLLVNDQREFDSSVQMYDCAWSHRLGVIEAVMEDAIAEVPDDQDRYAMVGFDKCDVSSMEDSRGVDVSKAYHSSLWMDHSKQLHEKWESFWKIEDHACNLWLNVCSFPCFYQCKHGRKVGHEMIRETDKNEERNDERMTLMSHSVRRKNSFICHSHAGLSYHLCHCFDR